MELQNPFTILFTSFLFLFLLLEIVKRSSSKNSYTNLPPGPWKLPFIGNIHQFVGSMPHHSMRDLAAKYGPIMHLKLGEVSNIIVSSAEIASQIMKTHDANFSYRPESLFAKIFSYNASDIEFSQYGDYWRQLRKICTVELLSAKRVQSFRFIREEEVSKLAKIICTSEGSIVNLSPMISSLLHGISARSAFGKINKNQKILISAIEEGIFLAGELWVSEFYPSLTVLQKLSKTKAKLEKLHIEADKILQEILDDHKNKKSSESEDLIDVLLKFQNDKDSQPPLTDDNIKAIGQEMFGGGGETTSSTVVWCLSEMIKKPKVMEEAQAEVRKVYDNKGYVDESELHQLIYLKAVIKETLRLHPPVPLLMPRENKDSSKINGYDIPPKCKVLINAFAIGRDPKYWNEPESFNPERFLNSSVDYKGTDFEFIPFGAGRRICPGITFAIPNMELPLATLLYHFDWKLPNGMKNEELDMDESSGLAIKRKNDLCLIPIVTRMP
ncbi:PREDICTED: cytochrome P450 71D10-like [Lupinus angustifolius]|uniref:cytochrome P450 71D10-like n=1 Tax=Lupinus angustifolius TaxID=3871 RepID=UPI00092EC36C|nr:PREDICTED: cytochrome P450 71D10-like [Lupinus angustifolius]